MTRKRNCDALKGQSRWPNSENILRFVNSLSRFPHTIVASRACHVDVCKLRKKLHMRKWRKLGKRIICFAFIIKFLAEKNQHWVHLRKGCLWKVSKLTNNSIIEDISCQNSRKLNKVYLLKLFVYENQDNKMSRVISEHKSTALASLREA